MNFPLEEYLFPWIISNVVSLALLFVCYKWSRIGRYLFSFIFLAACIVNTLEAIGDPHTYVETYGKLAFFFYKDFIHGFFARHTTVIVLAIAAGQLLISVFLFLGKKFFIYGVSGGIIFLLAITPLGLGSAFPATLLMAAALAILFKKHRK
ncbi:MAG: hypothetical protein GTO24_02085 [candidate division Zixibacteria bacterium]|nr:hypothetical protein [candidate division Zixibacteria bacterium]